MHFTDKSEIRKYMSQHCKRKGDDGVDQARYALKQLKPTDVQKQLETGLLDIMVEAQFLACLNHPNVVRIFFFVFS